MGLSKEDFVQIERAFAKTITKYELLSEDESDMEIPREDALDILGREKYLSGICRSAFHWTSVRENARGQKVYFDSSRLFK